jgi:hypothetical protein
MKAIERVQLVPNLTLYKYAPLLSILYTISNFYVFGWILNSWNSFDTFTVLFSLSHLLVPLYTFALSLYEYPTAQFVIYYFSSVITTLANALLAFETGLTLIGLFAQTQSASSTTMSLFTSNFVNNMFVISIPFAGMTMYLYYMISQYEKVEKPQDTRLYQGHDIVKEDCKVD